MSLFNYECDEVKRIIEEVSPNYPQLTTYEKEWIFFHKYHYIPGIPVELECQEVIVNPMGTVQNAIPYPYKSAILKGNTMNNLLCDYSISESTVKMNHKNIVGKVLIKNMCKGEQCFFKRLEITTGAYKGATLITSNNFIYEVPDGQYITTIYDHESVITPSELLENAMIIKYQEGMENWDIPYFEGMKSVQMPVLTTSNEDGTKTNILTVNEDVTLRSNGDVYDELNLLTGRLTQRIDENNEVLAQAVVKTVDLTTLTKPYEGTNHYHLTANIPCEAIIEVPVVSTGEQTLQDINNY